MFSAATWKSTVRSAGPSGSTAIATAGVNVGHRRAQTSDATKAIAVAARSVHPATGSTSRCRGIANARAAMTMRLLRRSAREGDIRLVSNRTQKPLPRLQLKIEIPELFLRHAIVDDGLDNRRNPIGVVVRLPD